MDILEQMFSKVWKIWQKFVKCLQA